MNTSVDARMWRLDHIGHAVRNLDEAISRYSELFGLKLDFKETLGEYLVETAFLSAPNTSIELLAPMPGNAKLEKFLSARGEGIHHFCFEVLSVADELDRLTRLGAELIDRQPRPGARGSQIAFLHPHASLGALIELCSYPRAAA